MFWKQEELKEEKKYQLKNIIKWVIKLKKTIMLKKNYEFKRILKKGKHIRRRTNRDILRKRKYFWKQIRNSN